MAVYNLHNGARKVFPGNHSWRVWSAEEPKFVELPFFHYFNVSYSEPGMRLVLLDVPLEGPHLVGGVVRLHAHGRQRRPQRLQLVQVRLDLQEAMTHSQETETMQTMKL